MKPPLIERRAVVVTGVSSGIGRAMADDLVAAGFHVFGSVRRLTDAQALIDLHGVHFTPLVFDVTDASALPGVVALVTQQLGGRALAALVNNAGVSLNGPLLMQPMAEVRQTFEVNVFAVIEVTRAFVPLLAAGAKRQSDRPGRVVHIGSVSGAMTAPFMGAYSASKHALEAVSQAMRRELLTHGIEVSTIEPNFVRSRIFEKTALLAAEQRYAGSCYEAMWQQFNRALLSQEQHAKAPQIVTRAVLQALTAKRPRTRYPLDPLWYLARVLPDRLFDALIFNALGLTHLLRRPRPPST